MVMPTNVRQPSYHVDEMSLAAEPAGTPQDLYFVFLGEGSDELFNFDWWQFE
jgi:hypothetical protein